MCCRFRKKYERDLRWCLFVSACVSGRRKDAEHKKTPVLMSFRVQQALQGWCCCWLLCIGHVVVLIKVMLILVLVVLMLVLVVLMLVLVVLSHCCCQW